MAIPTYLFAYIYTKGRENGLGLLIAYTLPDIGNCRIRAKHSEVGTEAKNTVVEILSKYSVSVPPSLPLPLYVLLIAY